MHLLYVSQPGGGLDTNVRILAPALARTGHSVSILYIQLAREFQAIPHENDLHVYRTRVGNLHYYFSRALSGTTRIPMILRALETAWTLRRMLEKITRDDSFDLVELPEGFGLARWMRGMSYVVRLHSSAWMCRVMFREPAFPSDVWERSAEAELLRGARGVSSPSRFVADYISRVCRVQQPIEIIPYPIDAIRFAPARESREPLTILFVGRIERRKGAEVLMHAIPLVQKKFPDCEFVFAGSISHEMQALMPFCFSEGQGVRFLGGVPREQLIKWYQRATILAAPSLWDNSPNTIYESMACGTPVIATRVGGIPELVDDGVTGLLVPPHDEHALADALIALLSDSVRCEWMGKCAREKAIRNYTIENILAQTLALYDRTLSS